LLDRIEVPFLSGRGLVMPRIVAGVGVDRDDRRKKPIVALAQTPISLVPLLAITRTEIDEVEFRIVGEGFPDRAAAASLPPLAMPCLGSFGENRALRRFCRIARHGIEAPRQLARLCVVR